MKNPWIVFIIATISLCSLSALADGKFVCTLPGVSLSENLTIQGTGEQAKVHVQDTTLFADLTYNADMSAEAAQAFPALLGYDAFFGPTTDTIDHVQGNSVFFIQPSLLVPGGKGQIARPAGEPGNGDFAFFSCAASGN